MSTSEESIGRRIFTSSLARIRRTTKLGVNWGADPSGTIVCKDSVIDVSGSCSSRRHRSGLSILRGSVLSSLSIKAVQLVFAVLQI